MSWITQTLTSSIGRKLVMALTGLFLCTFLVIHLLGNFQLLFNDAGASFNAYAYNMTTNPVIKIVSWVTYIGIILHAVQGLMLTMQNRNARPIGYAVNKANENSAWASRNMGVLGTVVLAFIVIHMQQFWFKYKFGEVPLMPGTEYKDLYQVVNFAFENPLYVAFYVLCMAAIAFHLHHGFQSAFRSLGLNHPKYTPLIQSVGTGFAIFVPLGFALIPIIMFFK